MTVNKEALFAKRVKELVVSIPDVGDVKVRALTRSEVLGLGIVPGQSVELDLAVAEQKLLSRAMVEPTMTEADVKSWQDSSPASEINVVFMAVIELSGLNSDGPKEMVKQFP